MKEYEVVRHALFFSDKDAKQLYKQFAKTIIQRRNIINGRIYRDDPTIMAWSLINEPRCETWKVKPLVTVHLTNVTAVFYCYMVNAIRLLTDDQMERFAVRPFRAVFVGYADSPG
jgi:endo-1,4-beta-mannosidase